MKLYATNKFVDYSMMVLLCLAFFFRLFVSRDFEIRDMWIIVCLLWVIIARTRDKH